MKRLVSGAEAAHAGLIYGGAVWVGPWTRWRAVGCIDAMRSHNEQLSDTDAFQLWRSLPGYRKACRMLRRSGRRVRQQFDRSAWAKGEATLFKGMDAPPVYIDSFSPPAVFSGLDCAADPSTKENQTDAHR